MKRLREKILFLVVLIAIILPALGAPHFAGQAAVQNAPDISLQAASFEKAYCLARDNWIFVDGNKSILEGALIRLGRRSNLPQPILGNNDEENFQAVKRYFQDLCLSNPRRADEYIYEAVKGMILPDFFSRVIALDKIGEEFNISGEMESDGLEITWQEGKVLVLWAHPKSPAALAGFEIGDRILEVNSVSFIGLDEEQAENIFEKLAPQFGLGKEIIYLVERGNEQLTFKTKIVKLGSSAKEQDVHFRRDGKIGIIRIDHFSLGIGQEFLKALDKLNKQGITGLILDLRGNPGGFSGETGIVIKALTGGGYRIKGQKFEYVRENKSVNGPLFSGPMAVLVNGGSASASEIVAACLRERGAKIFGCAPTWGKNFGQGFYILPNKLIFLMSDHVNMTLGGYTWPDGIPPDVLTENDNESMAKAKEYLKQREKTSSANTMPEIQIPIYNRFLKYCVE